jgi:hypothetical protein
MLSAEAPANVFAQFEGTLPAGEERLIPIHVSRTLFDVRTSHVVLGFVVRAPDGSTLDPAAVQVRNVAGGATQPERAAADLGDGRDSLLLTPLKPGDYTLAVRGDHGTAGAFQLDAFLAGDVNGDLSVDDTDGDAVKGLFGSTAGDGRYVVEADADLDGRIHGYDLAQQRRNKGNATSVRPLSLTAGLSPAPVQTLPDGTLVTEAKAVSVTGLTGAGAGVLLDNDGDGFDDGATAAGPAGEYSLPTTLEEGRTCSSSGRQTPSARSASRRCRSPWLTRVTTTRARRGRS